jgi:hypothetical protein
MLLSRVLVIKSTHQQSSQCYEAVALAKICLNGSAKYCLHCLVL